MSDTPATSASVASRLTDEEIHKLARIAEEVFSSEYEISAVLRDYVRMRTENSELEREIESKKGRINGLLTDLNHKERCIVKRTYENARLWKLTNAVKAKVAECRSCDTYNYTEYCREAIEDIERLLAEAEKGEAK